MQQTSVQKQKNLKKIGGFSMFKKMKHMKNEKGLTLIELLAVIVILAIIAAIAIPAIGNIISNQRDKAILAELSNAISLAELAYVDGTCAASCVGTDFGFKEGKATSITVSDLDKADPKIAFTATFSKTDAKFAVTTGVTKSALHSKMGR